MNDDDIDLLGQNAEQDVEGLPEGNALGSFSTFSTASTSGSTYGCASTAAAPADSERRSEMTDHIDLNAIEDLEPEPMSEGDALGCCFSASSYSTSSCPGGTVASLGSASTLG